MDRPIIAQESAWTPLNITYTSIIAVLACAKFFELILVFGMFTWAFYKAFRKADRIGVKILSVFITLIYSASRSLFFPIIVSTVPLPHNISNYFPPWLSYYAAWITFWSFSLQFSFSWMFCIYRITTESIGRHARVKGVLDEKTAPPIVIVMPVYNEIPSVLFNAIDSAVESDYPKAQMHIFVSFDSLEVSTLYLETIEALGVPKSTQSYPISIDVIYKECRITVSRFQHGGKRSVQKKTFALINTIYREFIKANDNLFMLFIDSDIVLDKYAIQNFMYDMELKPGSNGDVIAMTGVITCTTEKQSFLTLFQDMEYVHGLLFGRAIESACGAVTCLPGALTILRFSAFRRMAKHYFADQVEHCQDLFDYAKCNLGEDRWLTHLYMLGAKKPYQIKMCTTAFCKTQAVVSFSSLLKQRRRWLLGFVTTEVCILTDPRMWRRYPLVLFLRLVQDIMGANFFFFAVFLSIAFQIYTWTFGPLFMLTLALGSNWILMIFFGVRIHRFKAWLYPIMCLTDQALYWVTIVYGILTATQRTWGGPRVDANKKDIETGSEKSIPSQIISHLPFEYGHMSLQPPSPSLASFRGSSVSLPYDFAGPQNGSRGSLTMSEINGSPRLYARTSSPLGIYNCSDLALDSDQEQRVENNSRSLASLHHDILQSSPRNSVTGSSPRIYARTSSPLAIHSIVDLGAIGNSAAEDPRGSRSSILLAYDNAVLLNGPRCGSPELHERPSSPLAVRSSLDLSLDVDIAEEQGNKDSRSSSDC